MNIKQEEILIVDSGEQCKSYRRDDGHGEDGMVRPSKVWTRPQSNSSGKICW